MKMLVMMTAIMPIVLMANTRAEACLVKDPSGALNVLSSPNGRVVGALKNGTLVVIEMRRGSWVNITPHAKRSETPAWVPYSKLDCDFVDDVSRQAEQQGKTPEQFADEILRDTKPVTRTDKQLRSAAFTVASMMALDRWCKVPLTYGERVEIIVIGAQVGRLRLDAALGELDEHKQYVGASEFCLRLENGMRGKLEQ